MGEMLCILGWIMFWPKIVDKKFFARLWRCFIILRTDISFPWASNLWEIRFFTSYLCRRQRKKHSSQIGQLYHIYPVLICNTLWMFNIYKWTIYEFRAFKNKIIRWNNITSSRFKCPWSAKSSALFAPASHMLELTTKKVNCWVKRRLKMWKKRTRIC